MKMLQILSVVDIFVVAKALYKIKTFKFGIKNIGKTVVLTFILVFMTSFKVILLFYY